MHWTGTMSLPEPEKDPNGVRNICTIRGSLLVVEPGELRREVISVDAGRVDPLSMNAIVEALDELADAAARLRRHALPRRRLIEPQVIGVLRTGRAGVDRVSRSAALRNLVLEVARRVLPRVAVDRAVLAPDHAQRDRRRRQAGRRLQVPRQRRLDDEAARHRRIDLVRMRRPADGRRGAVVVR